MFRLKTVIVDDIKEDASLYQPSQTGFTLKFNYLKQNMKIFNIAFILAGEPSPQLNRNPEASAECESGHGEFVSLCTKLRHSAA